MHRAGGVPIGLQPLLHGGEQGVLFLGVGVVFGGVAVRHGKMLEHTADLQPRQGVQRLHLAQGFLKAGTHRKADAPHTGVHF